MRIVGKREAGQYFTTGNPFSHPSFLHWAHKAGLPSKQILEPFAGSNNLIALLEGMGLCQHSISYDLIPAAHGVQQRDTLRNFPKGYDVCITNPPWLAKNSATVRGLGYPSECPYDNVYKYALEQSLIHCGYVAMLVPESFITAHVLQDRLQDFISITAGLFSETTHPVGLALFVPEPVQDVTIWSGMTQVGLLSKLKSLRPSPHQDGFAIHFNREDGNVGLIALDNTKEASIRFCEVRELADYRVKATGRHITKLLVNSHVKIGEWNAVLNEFRDKTQDVLMTCYKGMRKDGKYRRRCDWALARGVIHHVN